MAPAVECPGPPLRPAGCRARPQPGRQEASLDSSAAARVGVPARFARPAAPVASLPAAGSARPGARGNRALAPRNRGVGACAVPNAREIALALSFVVLLRFGRLHGRRRHRSTATGSALSSPTVAANGAPVNPRLELRPSTGSGLRVVAEAPPCPTTRSPMVASRLALPRCGTRLAPGLAPGAAIAALCARLRTRPA
ncbi:MAG: hypothetical protein WC378_16740 [Opitutaceae bacterium]